MFQTIESTEIMDFKSRLSSLILRKTDAFLLYEKEAVNYFDKFDTEISIDLHILLG